MEHQMIKVAFTMLFYYKIIKKSWNHQCQHKISCSWPLQYTRSAIAIWKNHDVDSEKLVTGRFMKSQILILWVGHLFSNQDFHYKTHLAYQIKKKKNMYIYNELSTSKLERSSVLPWIYQRRTWSYNQHTEKHQNQKGNPWDKAAKWSSQ